MDLKVSLLWILFWCNIVNQIGETEAKVKYILVTDLQQIDRYISTYSYIESQKNWIMQIARRIGKKLTKSVCHNVSFETKWKFCKEFLDADANGFKLASSTEEEFTCEDEDHNIFLHTRGDSERSTLHGFYCPQVTYTDLETEEDRPLEFTYKISIAKKRTEALFFFKKASEPDLLYPQYYVKKIDFYRSFYDRPKKPSTRKIEVNNDALVQKHLEAKRLTFTYEKFDKFLWSINVCWQRRAAIIYLCKQSIMRAFKRTESSIKFDLLGYKGGRCKKSVLEQVGQPKNELSLVQCPFVILNNKSAPPSNMFFVHYYVASNLWYHSTTLFVRENEKGKTTVEEANIIKLPMDPVYQYYSRDRYMPLTVFDNWRPPKTDQEMEDEINLVAGDLQMPYTLARLGPFTVKKKAAAQGPLRTNHDKWFNDYITITFSRVQKTTQIYQRFVRTYKSMDICQLTIKQKVALCSDALRGVDDPEFKLAYFVHKLNLDCTRNRVVLSVREAEELETDSMLMWECPHRDHRFDKHYLVGKNHLKDAATVYKRIEVDSQSYYFPHILVTDINKYELADVEMSRLRIGARDDDDT